MKCSNYNFLYSNILPDTNECVAYNARTGALAVLESEKADVLYSKMTFKKCHFVIQ